MKRVLSLALILSLPAASACAQSARVQAVPAGALPAFGIAAGAVGIGLRPGPVVGVAAAARIQRPAMRRGSPFARTMRALAARAPDFKGMGMGGARGAAGKDFESRISGDEPVELLVSAPEGSGRHLTEDVYPAYLGMPGMTDLDVRLALRTQLQELGVSQDLLASHDARAVGALSQINTAVLAVPAGSARALESELRALGLSVQQGRTFEVPRPMAAAPGARTVGLREMASIIGADRLQAELRKVLGDPVPPARGKGSWLHRAAAALGLAPENPSLPWAILDSWVSTEHPFLSGRFVKSVANESDKEKHGTHTAGTVVGVDPWNFEGRNYNIFPKGRATEGDILFKLNMAQQDGALATTNSWGDGRGNPEGAIERLFVKTAEAGMHHSISAGNSGSAKNTVGGPAIAVFNAPVSVNGSVVGEARRVKAVAAADADKKTAYFSSRGPGSKTTAADPERYKDYPRKPDEAGMGVRLVAPVPSGPVVDELGGPGEPMSGTSMSNPGVFGAFLLLTRGILVLHRDLLPALPSGRVILFAMDLARWAMTRTAVKTDGPDEVGDGFIDVWAAFELSGKTLRENAPRGPAARAWAAGLRVLRRFV